VGTNLFEALKGDFHLVGLDVGSPGKYPPEDFFSWDALDRIPPVDAIIHLAGKAHDTARIARDEEYFEVNTGLTQKIFDYFLHSTARKFIFFSSAKAVADTVRGEWLTEEDTPEPLTAYGRSKLEAERFILSRVNDFSPPSEIRLSQSSFLNSPFSIPLPQSVYVLRPAMIHGPGNKGNLNLLYRAVVKGIPWPLGAFENQRSFTSMENCAFVMRRLLEGDIPTGIYNLADDEPVSTNEIIGLIASSLHRKPRIWRVPEGFIRAVARSGDFLRLPLNSERLKKLTETYRVSNAKIKVALGIEKLPVTSVEGLRKTLQSFGKLH